MNGRLKEFILSCRSSLKVRIVQSIFIILVLVVFDFYIGFTRNNTTLLYIFNIIVFVITAVLFLFVLAAKYSIKDYFVKREVKFRNMIIRLRKELEETRFYLKQVDSSYIDPLEAGLTKAEVLLLEKLCLYKESNLDLGTRLNKSPNTVKVQLTRIMNKIGADTRYQLIDLCRNYFLIKK